VIRNEQRATGNERPQAHSCFEFLSWNRLARTREPGLVVITAVLEGFEDAAQLGDGSFVKQID
jgi:hypothetical protein